MQIQVIEKHLGLQERVNKFLKFSFTTSDTHLVS